jgi:hypothetical protein
VSKVDEFEDEINPAPPEDVPTEGKPPVRPLATVQARQVVTGMAEKRDIGEEGKPPKRPGGKH